VSWFITLEAMITRPLFLLSAFLWPAFSLAAPAPKTTRKAPTKQISIDPVAKAILERMARLYGVTPKWKAQIIEPPSPGVFAARTYRYDLSYARPAKLRIEQRFDSRVFVDVLVGQQLEDFLEVSPMADFGVEIYTFLQGKTGLEEAQAWVKWSVAHR
jgi:hypothetical protein